MNWLLHFGKSETTRNETDATRARRSQVDLGSVPTILVSIYLLLFQALCRLSLSPEAIYCEHEPFQRTGNFSDLETGP
jgi:hypothetical protein